jgi:hypothetical protein
MADMPLCRRCGLHHWRFKPCSEGQKYVRVGYDTLERETDYQRLQYRSRPRLTYHEEEKGQR